MRLASAEVGQDYIQADRRDPITIICLYIFILGNSVSNIYDKKKTVRYFAVMWYIFKYIHYKVLPPFCNT